MQRWGNEIEVETEIEGIRLRRWHHHLSARWAALFWEESLLFFRNSAAAKPLSPYSTSPIYGGGGERSETEGALAKVALIVSS
jgi:hypothetical protein